MPGRQTLNPMWILMNGSTFPAIRAVTTLMLDLPKRGLLDPAVRPFVGELYLADLGIPMTVHDRLGVSLSNIFDEGPIVRLRR